MSRLAFEKQPKPSSRKTEIWTVVAAEGEVRLGEVRWFASWRRYIFSPDQKMLFDAGCLEELARFCSERTNERKRSR